MVRQSMTHEYNVDPRIQHVVVYSNCWRVVERAKDFWLHPCDCLPLEWGSGWPADAMALENIPPTSDSAHTVTASGSCSARLG